MSLSANIDHLAIAAGIEAVVVDIGSREYRGDDQWYRVLDGALDLFRRTDERSIRLVVGKHTIVVQKEGEETVAVVLPTGHAIAKSLRRMIRRMARKDRGPLPKEFTSGQQPSIQPASGPPSSHATGQPAHSHTQQPNQQPTPSGPAHSIGVTTPSPSPVSSPSSTTPSATPPSGGQPSVAPQPKTNEEAKPGVPNQGQAGERPADRGSSDASGRGGFHNF